MSPVRFLTLGIEGCKRPLRSFFCPMVLPGIPHFGAARASSSASRPPPGHKFLYNTGATELPHRVILEPLPLDCPDVGNCSVWNQFEFGLFLTSVADEWKVSVVETRHETCDRHMVIKVLRECEKVKATMMPPQDANPGENQEEKEMDIFESFLLKPGGSNTATSTPFLFGDDADAQTDDDSDHSFFGDLEEQDGDNDFADVVGVGSASDSDGQNAIHRGRSDRRRDEDEQSRAGSAGSRASGGTRTVATDTDLLKSVLGSRLDHRWDGCNGVAR